MIPNRPTRAEAWDLLREHTQGDGLRKHALAVEAAMRAYAGAAGADPELWGIAGLLHDFDYEKHPTLEEHPAFGVDLLRRLGYPEEILRAILAHAPHTGVVPETPMEKTLFAVDELCGFLTACALVQPGKKLSEVRVSSVKKKLNDKAFARGVSREHIREGTEALGVDLDRHIEFVLGALASIAASLGLG
ncbi:MAG TPA: HDIG domain-containing protein [Candidatus Polarisedimenticolia bacterium]|jgi:putative nucleotidyltransferase with HDIG domain|nr:HDIG domain-containing protein [Candidatus Polarisedimenticolia bacterium]